MADNPDYYAELYLNLGLSLQFAGDIAAAEAAYEQAITLRPAFFKAHSALSTLQRQTPERNHLERLEQLKKGAATAVDKLHVGHALAREQEDLGQLHAAIESLQWAKREQAREVKYSFEQEREYFHNIRAIFDRGCFEFRSQDACDNDEPIFIVGMPRTGTTLVEQILGSHSKVFAAGELQQFPQQVLSLTDVSNPGALTTNRLHQLIDKELQALGQGYIDNTRPRTGHTSHFIDKLPRNFLYLGLIYLALPRAKLICLRRDPMDTCLSNYRQLFANQLRQYQYNLDLLDCGRYYIEFDKLMRHWRQTIPSEVYELSYESLVDNQEAETQKLLDFCNLPWEDECLTFHQRRNAVATPSAGQVKQGIYSHSVDRWKRFGDAMDPLYALLREAGYYT
mgnify:CR=1 FL=1